MIRLNSYHIAKLMEYASENKEKFRRFTDDEEITRISLLIHPRHGNVIVIDAPMWVGFRLYGKNNRVLRDVSILELLEDPEFKDDIKRILGL